jgi:regulatory protein
VRSLKARALQWLAQREHSRAELQRKLMPHAQLEEAVNGHAADGAQAEPRTPHSATEPAPTAAARVEALLDWLEANRFLSEQRFAESRIHARSSRYGNLRIRQELAQHGVALSDSAESELQGSELERARAVWARKFSALAVTSSDAGARARQARFMIGRGFSLDVVRRVLREAAARDGVERTDDAAEDG